MEFVRHNAFVRTPHANITPDAWINAEQLLDAKWNQRWNPIWGVNLMHFNVAQMSAHSAHDQNQMKKKSIIWHGAGKMAIFVRLWWSTSNYRVTFFIRLYFFFNHFDGNADDYADSIQEKKSFACKSEMVLCIGHDARAMFPFGYLSASRKKKMRATTCQMAASNWQYLKSLAAKKNGQASDNAFGMSVLALQNRHRIFGPIFATKMFEIKSPELCKPRTLKYSKRSLSRLLLHNMEIPSNFNRQTETVCWTQSNVELLMNCFFLCFQYKSRAE